MCIRDSPDASGRAIARCALNALDPIIEQHNILTYELFPNSDIKHVCQLPTFSGGMDHFCNRFDSLCVPFLVSCSLSCLCLLAPYRVSL